MIHDGRVFVAAGHPADDRAAVRLVVLDAADGSRLTATTVTDHDDPRTSDRLVWDSLVVRDGRVFLLAFDGLHALGTDGTHRWHVPFGGAPAGTILAAGQPAVVDDVVYAPTAGTTTGTDATEGLVALDAATGDRRWRYDAGEAAVLPPASASGIVYAALLGRGVVALDAATGAVRWTTTAPTHAPPTVVGDTVLHATDGIDRSAVVALDAATGDRLWRAPGDGERIGRRIAVHPELGVCYHRRSLDTLVARDIATGRRRWTADFRSVSRSGIAVTADRLYVTVSTAAGEAVAVLDSATGERLAVVPLGGGGLRMPFALADSMLVTVGWSAPVTAVGSCPVPVAGRCLVS